MNDISVEVDDFDDANEALDNQVCGHPTSLKKHTLVWLEEIMEKTVLLEGI